MVNNVIRAESQGSDLLRVSSLFFKHTHTHGVIPKEPQQAGAALELLSFCRTRLSSLLSVTRDYTGFTGSQFRIVKEVLHLLSLVIISKSHEKRRNMTSTFTLHKQIREKLVCE